MFLLTAGAAILLSAILYWFVYNGEVPPKAGVYRQPGKWYWLKRLVFFVIFHVRSMKRHTKEKRPLVNLVEGNGQLSGPGDDMKGYGAGETYEAMERPQRLTDDPYAIDSIYFGGTDVNGTKISCRLARRKSRCAEIWLFLEVPGIGCLQHTCHPDTHVYYTDEFTFKAGGLTCEVLEPIRRWRVSFSGKLRKALCNDVTNKPQDYAEVNFSFIWSASSQPFSFDTDMASSMLGDSIARELWSKSFLGRLKSNHQTHYEQWGELRGRLCVEGHDEKMLYLQCVRDHSYGTRDWRDFHRYIIHFIYLETGLSIQVGIFSQPNLMSHVKLGYVSYANGDIVPVSDVGLRLWDVGESPNTPPQSYTFSFCADGIEYNVEVEGGTTPIWYHHDDRGGKVMDMFSKFKVNSKPGRGIAEFFYRNHDGPSFTPPPFVPMIIEPSTEVIEENKEKVTLFFSDPSCHSPLLVGGKGAQLAQLTSLQKELDATVPEGFCLTLHSFQLQLKSNLSIEESIDKVTQCCVYNQEELPSACNACLGVISKSDVCPKVRDWVLDSLHQVKGPKYTQCHFAVRSSAAGEDGDEASSAGQMETVLGVIGKDKIFEAIKQCWSSAYTLQAVEYRRQHGQPIKSMVGVVVQEMVPAEAAGVMFTADPISGSSSHIVINANFGLGESVVSGKSDPDTIVVERDQDSLILGGVDGLKIGKVTVGQKKIQITETGDGGIKEEATSGMSSSLSISDGMILKLARLGIELEKRFGCPRDIEWAVVKEDIYLLQCRPITVASSETENDFLHEFDSPMNCDYQWNTTANISEMMPGAMTPLTFSTFMRSIEYSLQFMNYHAGGRKSPTHLTKGLPCICNNLFIALIDISTMFVTTYLVRKDIMEISLLGNLLPELQLEEAKNYYGRQEGFYRRLINFVGLLRIGSKAGDETSKWEKKIPSYSVGTDAKTAVDLYHCIHSSLCDYKTVWLWTLINSSRSGNWSSILMSVLGGEATDWTNSHYGDMALLLSKCQDVYSAEVPHALENIAKEISSIQPPIVAEFLDTPDEVGFRENYLKVFPQVQSDLHMGTEMIFNVSIEPQNTNKQTKTDFEQECMSMIQKHPSLKALVDLFLQRHGHRCLRESELREKSWRSSPQKFMSVLKSMVKTKSFDKETREVMSIPQLLDQLKSKPSVFKRFILKLLLPKAWKAVGAREWGKSISVQMSEIFKIAYYRLSQMMHQEGRLPDSDLMYFLTHQEIGTLLSSSSSKLIIRAQRRRKVLAKQEEIKFAKITRGRPVPITSKASGVGQISSSNGCLKGMPVSLGCVAGTARVVHSLDHASVIQAGDILVVKSTDVGWTPYFPLIGGLVTELGGLISHGAVVAREYGIPCVVNVSDATSILNSGDQVEIDGRQGTVIVKHLDRMMDTQD